MLKKINLQLFGEPEPENKGPETGGTGTEGNNEQTQNPDGTKEKKEEGASLPRTQEELDRIIRERLAREKKKVGGENEEVGKEKTVEAVGTEPKITVENMDGLLMRAQLKAYEEGKFNPKSVKDAVVLAVYEARSKGEVTEESIQEALKNVLTRNPEWGNKAEENAPFKVGADSTEEKRQQSDGVQLPKKTWNKFR